MIRIAVCDDERNTADRISAMIRGIMPESEVCTFLSGRELLAGAPFDLYFLDIQMPGENGIETAKRLRKRGDTGAIVFITGVKDYVFDAFDVEALHYLVKPVREEKLREVLGRAVRALERTGGAAAKAQLLIQTRERSFTVNVEDILYLENAMRKIIVHTRQKTISFYGKMADMERQTGATFFRTHRGYLVNLACVAEYSADAVTLCNGETVYLARDRYQDFVKEYMRYLRGEARHEQL